MSRLYPLCLAMLVALLSSAAGAAPEDYFVIEVVDKATGRGVPLVELETTDGAVHLTDSQGIVAFNEPGLMDRPVFFKVRSHGYEYPADGFNFRGLVLHTAPGTRARIPLSRINVAERLYRVTGGGIYRDSVLAGLPTPLRQPVLAGGVLGQDSVLAIPLDAERILWIWGDTNKPDYPLGNFAASGAISRRPDAGGLDPAVGVDLGYFVGQDGFSRKMAPLEGPGAVWMDGLSWVADGAGRPRLVAHMTRMQSLSEVLERGYMAWNPETERFEKVASLPIETDRHLRGNPIRIEVKGEPYLLFGQPHPSPLHNVRVPARLDAVTDPAAYEVYSCQVVGSDGTPRTIRDGAGRPMWAWRSDGVPMGTAAQAELMEAGELGPTEGWLALRDIESGASLQIHGGSVYWNPYRRRWVGILLEIWGSSVLGEVWYAEADTPTGPWVYARRIVTHDNYSFYHPKHHPFFDQEGGRLIYFEGTYTSSFTDGPAPRTPRYDYNQIMYRLDLADARLALPSALYQLKDGTLCFGPELPEDARPRRILCLASEPGRALPEMIPLYQTEGGRLTRDRPTGGQDPLFYGFPEANEGRPGLVPLYEHRARTGQHAYRAGAGELSGFERRAEPLCWVWEYPLDHFPWRPAR